MIGNGDTKGRKEDSIVQGKKMCDGRGILSSSSGTYMIRKQIICGKRGQVLFLFVLSLNESHPGRR